MSNLYKINITNNSGRPQKYVFFTERPSFSGGARPVAWQTVFARVDVGNNGQGRLTVSKNYYAMCGTSQGNLDIGATVSISSRMPVILGTDNNGMQMPGTTVPFTAANGYPRFDRESNKSAPVGSYQINTDGSFTNRDAIENNYIIGFCGSTNGDDASPMSVFVPQPNSQYQIRPSNTYYVACGDYTTGQVIDRSQVGNSAKLDFSNSVTSITVVQDESGNLTVRNG